MVKNKSKNNHGAETNKLARSSKHWTAEEDAFITANYGVMTYREIGVKLGRSANACFVRTAEIGIRKSADNIPGVWQEREKQYLLDNYRHMTIPELAADLGRSVKSVRRFVEKRHLRKNG